LGQGILRRLVFDVSDGIRRMEDLASHRTYACPDEPIDLRIANLRTASVAAAAYETDPRVAAEHFVFPPPAYYAETLLW
jgi:hypothetical protein